MTHSGCPGVVTCGYLIPSGIRVETVRLFFTFVSLECMQLMRIAHF